MRQIKDISELLALKIQTDKLKELANELQIEYLPTMFILYRKEIIDKLIGLPNEKKLNEFYKTIQILYEANKSEKELKALIEEATKQINEGDVNTGIGIVNEIKKREDLSTSYNGMLDTLLAKGHFRLNNIAEAKECFRRAMKHYKVAPMEELTQLIVSELTSKFDSAEIRSIEESAIEKLSAEIDIEPENNRKRYDLAVMLMKLGKYEDCANQCMDILRIDRNWEGGKPKHLLTEVLSIVGSSSELAIHIRQSLTSILFT